MNWHRKINVSSHTAKAKSHLIIQCYSKDGEVMNNILLIIKDAFCYFGSLRRDGENAICSLKAWLS